MAAFKFDFSLGEGQEETRAAPEPQATVQHAQPSAAAAEVFPSSTEMPTGAVQEVQLEYNESFLLRRFSSEIAADVMQNDILTRSDVIPGQYEGGLKLWESAVDLANFLLRRYLHDRTRTDSTAKESSMSGMRVLELGCGHGLPGIVCALAGALVYFQDYNAEALTALAAPNLQLNLRARQQQQCQQRQLQPRFFSGDWSNLGCLLTLLGEANSFDVIISAETLYSRASMLALYGCIKQCVKPGGCALIAAKTMYFGLDGGTLPFKELVRKLDPTVKIGTALQTNEGVCREVLCLSNLPVIASR